MRIETLLVDALDSCLSASPLRITAEKACKNMLKKGHNLLLGRNDKRAELSRRFFGVLQLRRRIRHILEHSEICFGISGMVLVYILFEERKYFPLCEQNVRDWIAFAKEQGESVDEILKIDAEKVTWPLDRLECLAAKYSFSDRLCELFVRDFGDQAEDFANSLNFPGGVVFRMNRNKVRDRSELRKMLSEYMETEDTKYSCDGVRVISPEKPKIRGTDAYDQGYYEVQDEGSQLICLSFETFPGMKIVDLCCGRGGKALHLASLLQSGNLVCHDIDLKKLNEAKLRISRPGICSSDLNINFICSESKNVLGGRGGDISMHSADEIDESDINVSGIIDLLNGHADVVLVDAPCSSLGTLRRGPNVRWEADIDQLLDLYPRMQKHILSQAVSLVKPGGSLIYATCTFSREECKDICEWFQNSYCVGDNAKFKPVPLRNWSTLFNLNFAEFHEKNVIQLSSHGNGTDTFFIARFDCLNN